MEASHAANRNMGFLSAMVSLKAGSFASQLRIDDIRRQGRPTIAGGGGG